MSSISTNITNKFSAQSHVPFIFRAVRFGAQSDIRVRYGRSADHLSHLRFAFSPSHPVNQLRCCVLLMPENPRIFPIKCSDPLKLIRSPAGIRLGRRNQLFRSCRLSVSPSQKSLSMAGLRASESEILQSVWVLKALLDRPTVLDLQGNDRQDNRFTSRWWRCAW
jgi:hypothetical protein